MRSTIAYYLLLVYVVAACKPFLPMIGDVLAHTFWQEYHAATVHQIEGNQHLHDEVLATHDEEGADNSVPAATRFAETVSVHYIQQGVFACSLPLDQKDYLPYYNKRLPEPIIQKIIPPPRA